LQSDENNVTSDEETSSKRSVRFSEESSEREGTCDGESQANSDEPEVKPIEYVSNTLKRNSSGLFNNALRPNSAVRQLFPATVITPVLSVAVTTTTAAITSTTSTTTTMTSTLTSEVDINLSKKFVPHQNNQHFSFYF
jgi:hypothetical protein